MGKEGIGTFLAFLTAIISGFSIFANKWFIVDLDPTVFTAVRAIIIGLVFLVLSLFFHSWKSKENHKINWSYLLIIGIIGGGLAFLLFFSGLKVTTGGRAAFLHKTLPFFVLILAYVFLKEKISKKQLWALALMLVGVGAITFATIPISVFWKAPSTGDALVLLATFLWAVENVVAKKAMLKGGHNLVVSFARMFFGGLFLFGVVLFAEKFNEILDLTMSQWFNILISTALLFGYVLTYYWSIRKISVVKASTILLLAPVITLLLGVVFYGEPAPAWQLVGGALILVGAYLAAGVKNEFSRI
ncbi:MAG: DMT family transporter [Nanoarchaeota archaeon]|nr:DMT family transporter [Nanoarchaeota archaeon]MBU0977141.1 DMT family transporter [Nanoarchaeota archaeon]